MNSLQSVYPEKSWIEMQCHAPTCIILLGNIQGWKSLFSELAELEPGQNTKVSCAFELPITAPFRDPFHTKFEACVYCPLKQPLFYGKCCSNCLLRRALCNTHAPLKENHSGIVYRDLMAQLILLHLFLGL